jgi:hypothetical protein
MTLSEKLDKINELETTYAVYNKQLNRIKSLSRILNDPKATKEDIDKALTEIQLEKKSLEKFISENGSGDDILTEIKSLRKDYVRVKYLTLQGNNISLNSDKFKTLDASDKVAFKIEPIAEVVRNFQNENVYVSIDLKGQRDVKIALPSIQNSLKSQNVNIWVSDLSGTIGGDFSLEIIGDEDSSETISGNDSIVLSESFSGALITPISLKQWGVFYASSIKSGSFEKDLSTIEKSPLKKAASASESAK